MKGFIINHIKKLGFKETPISANYMFQNKIICNNTIFITIQTYNNKYIIEGEVEHPTMIYPILYICTDNIENIYKAINKWLLEVHTKYVLRCL